MIKNYLKKMLGVTMLCIASAGVYAQATVTILVGQSGSNYSPANVSCMVGDTIRFEWVSGFHPTRSDNGTTIPEVTLDGSPGLGSEYKIKMLAAGTVPYYCTAHGSAGGGGMSGVITVTAPPMTTFTENFSYTAGTLLSANGYTAHSSGGTNSIAVSNGGLSYNGSTLSGIGNAAVIKGSGEDVSKAFTGAAITAGTVYASLLMKVDSAKTGDHFFHFGPIPVTTDLKGRVYVKASGAGYQIGFSKAGTTVTYDPTIFTYGVVNQLVVKYTAVAGAGNDNTSLFINPTLGGTEPAATITGVSTETDLTGGVGSIALRQGGAASAAGVTVDGIIVAQNWAAVTPLGVINPTVKLNPTTLTVAENAGNATITLNIANPTASATSVDVVLKGGSAIEGSDFTYAATHTVTFPAGSSAPQSFTIPIIDDATQETDETIELVLRNSTNSSMIDADSTLTITIPANDVVTPVVSFASASATKAENSGATDVEVTIINADANPTSVDVVLKATGTTADGSDFTFTSPATLTFPGGSSANQTATLTILDDNVTEGAETIVLALRNATNAAQIGTDSIYTFTISSNDQPLVAHFIPTTKSVVESVGTTTAGIMVMGINSNDSPTSFDVVIKGGTATEGADYTFVAQTITIPAHTDSNVTINIPIIDDSAVEGNETVILALRNITNSGIIPTDSVFTLTITENDVDFITIAQVSADDANGNPTYPTTTPMAVAGIVYSNNLRVGGLQFSLIDPTGATTIFRGTGNLNYTPTEGDSLVVYGKVSSYNGLNEVNADSIRVVSTGHPLRAAKLVTEIEEAHESDFIEFRNAHLANPAQWTNAGSGFNVDVTNGTDTIQLRIVNATDLYSMPAPTGTFNILGLGNQFDNSNPKNSGYQMWPRKASDIYTTRVVSFKTATATVTEAAGTVNVEVALDQPAVTALSVNVIHSSGTATHGSDFDITLPVTLSFQPGDSTAQFSVTIVDDSSVEPTEDLVLGFVAANNCTIGTVHDYTITITDNDVNGIAKVKAGTVKMYPNPARDVVKIQSQEVLQQVIVYNTIGQAVRNIQLSNVNEMNVEISDLAKGLYNVRVITEKGETTQHLIVQ